MELGLIMAMICVNAVFASYELALASVAPARLRRLEHDKVAGAWSAVYMKNNMEASLAVVQLGITLVGVIAAAVGGAEADEAVAPIYQARLGVSENTAEILAMVSVVVPLTAITILFGELVPKVFALRNTELVCLRLSPIMRWFALIVWPAVWAFETAVTLVMSWGQRDPSKSGKTEAAELQDLRAGAAMARAARLIGPRQEGIIVAAAALTSRTLSAVMLPAEHISLFYLGDSLDAALTAAHLDMHTRFPVTERRGDPQGIVGYVNVKDLVAVMRLSPHDPTLRSLVRPLPSLSIDLPVTEALERMMRDHTHIALVTDGERVAGMVTMEDILEEVVGDIQDEYDRLPAHLIRAGDGWIAGGGVRLERLSEIAQMVLPSPLSTKPLTLSDWVMEHHGPVKGGEVLEGNEFRLVVRKVRRHKLQEAWIGPPKT